MVARKLSFSLPFVILVASCSAKTTPAIVCPAIAVPAVIPIQQVFLAYPAPGATGVSDSIGTLVVGEIDVPAFGSTKLSVTATSSATQTPLVDETPGPAPSPLPSPLATGEFNGTPTYFSVPVPALSPGTTYSVYFNYVAGTPQCESNMSQDLNSFTTQ